MLAALLLAACMVPPLYEMDGPPCDPAAQTIECRCSECLVWDPTPTALWYELLRRNPDATTVNAGNTRWRNRPAYVDEDGINHPEVRPTLWCVPWDATPARAGELYGYEVRACNDTGCGAWSTSGVQHRATAYWCGRAAPASGGVTWCNGGRTP